MEQSLTQLIKNGKVKEIERILQDQEDRRGFRENIHESHLCGLVELATNHKSSILENHCITGGRRPAIDEHYGEKVLTLAAEHGDDQIVNWLLTEWINEGRMVQKKPYYFKQDLPPNWLSSSLCAAVKNRHVNTVRILVQRGWADVNACTDYNQRPIHFAADNVDKGNSDHMLRYKEIVVILLDEGAKVNYVNPVTGLTPLHDAVRLNNCEVTRILICHGAEVFTELDKIETTVLHTAAAAGFHETLRTIVEHDKVRNAIPAILAKEDKNGKTPIYLAAEKGHVECIRILMKKGLNPACGPKLIEVICKHVAQPVDLLTEIFDEQVSETNQTSNEVSFDFSLLKSDTVSENHSDASDDGITAGLLKHAVILEHPLVETFLNLQYKNIQQREIIFFVPQLLFVCMVSLLVMYPTVFTWGIAFEGMILSILIVNIWITSYDNWTRLSQNGTWKHMSSLCLILLASSVGSISEIVMTYVLLFKDNNSQNVPSIALFEGFTVLLSWINLIIFSTRFPMLAEYLYMFRAVLWKVLKVLYAFSLLVFGFASTCSVLFTKSDQFNTPLNASVNTLVILIGEYEFSTLLKEVESSSSGAGSLIFLIFVIFARITLMNLVTSLAITDVHELLKEGRRRMLINQAECLMLTWHRKGKIPSKTTLTLNSIPVEIKTGLNRLALRKCNRNERSRTVSEISLADIHNTMLKLLMISQKQQVVQEVKKKEE